MKTVDEFLKREKRRKGCLLYTSGFGGVYWYETDATPEIYDDLHAAPLSQDVPMNLGEPEAPYCKLLAPAIYKELSITDEYDYLEKYGAKNIGEIIKVGSCSADYANKRWGSFTMLTEEPYFFDRRINDLSDADVTRAEAALEGLDLSLIHIYGRREWCRRLPEERRKGSSSTTLVSRWIWLRRKRDLT